MSSVFSFLRFHRRIQPAQEDGKYLWKLERTFTGFVHLFCSYSKSGFTCISSSLRTPLIKTQLTNHFHGNRPWCYMTQNISVTSLEQNKLFVSVRNANWRIFFFPKRTLNRNQRTKQNVDDTSPFICFSFKQKTKHNPNQTNCSGRKKK